MPTPSEIAAQTLVEMLGSGRRAAAKTQMERDLPVLKTHEPVEGAGLNVPAIVELARETESIPDAFAMPMGQLLRGRYSPQAKMDLVRLVQADQAQAKAVRESLVNNAPALARMFSGLLDDALSLPARPAKTSRTGGSRTWLIVGVLVAVAVAAAAAFLATRS